MTVTIEFGTWSDMQKDAAAIRLTVFVDEQRVPLEEELDAADADCVHFVARDETGRAVGCARLLPDGHIGRVAVLKELRGRGVGRSLVQAAVAHARELGFKAVALNAQTQAQGFYTTLGFHTEGGIFSEAGIPHVRMVLTLGA